MPTNDRIELKICIIRIFARGTQWWYQNYNILTYWRLRLYCDVKYHAQYHKTAQKSIQMMLKCQKMIGFIPWHIFICGSHWSYQWSSQNMIFWLHIWRHNQVWPFRKVKWLEFRHHHSDSRCKFCDHAYV